MTEYIIDTEKTPPVARDLILREAGSLEEVVRCRDCRFWATELRFTGECVGKAGNPDPDGYCAWGERKQ